MKAEHITFDPDLGELRVKLPDTLPLRESGTFSHSNVRMSTSDLSTISFFLPVFNDPEPILQADIEAPIVIRMGPDSTVAYVELISTNRFYHPSGVHVAPERSHEELGVSGLGMSG